MCRTILAIFLFSAVLNAQAHQVPAAPTKLPLTLVGTIVRADAEKSLATVMFTTSKSTNVYSAGKKISNLADTVKVERERLLIKNTATGVSEYIALGAYDSGRAVKPGNLDKPGADTEFHIQRSLVDETIKDLPKFLAQARAVPVKDSSGQITGFQLEYIEPGSLYEKLGLKQGDTLRSVNGVALTSIQGAVEVYMQFKDSSMIQLKIDRGGRAVNATYLVR